MSNMNEQLEPNTNHEDQGKKWKLTISGFAGFYVLILYYISLEHIKKKLRKF